MWRPVLTLLLMLMAPSLLLALEVFYTGAKPTNSRAIERMLVGRNGIDSAYQILYNDGYFDALITTTNDTVRIAAGERYFLGSVLLSNGHAVEVPPETPFTQRRVGRILEGLLREQEAEGHYWATVTIDSLRKHNGLISMELELNEGPVVRLSELRYEGLVRTDSTVLNRYFSVDRGDTVTDRTVARVANEAAGIDFVTFLPPVRVRPNEGYTSADLDLRFIERRQFTFEGGGAYVPETSSGFLWNLHVRFNNLFGGGRQAIVDSERRERGRNRLRLRYEQPAFLIGVGRIAGEVATRDYRDEFYEFAVDAAYTARLSAGFGAGLGLGWKRVEPQTNRAGYGRFASRFSIDRSSLDDPLNPRRGLRLAWSLTYSYRRYRDDTLAVRPQRKSFSETRAAARVEWFQPLIGTLIGYVAVNYEGLKTDESLPPLSELTLIGGPGSIRGYRNEQFAVLRTAYGSVEPRIRFEPGYLFAFYDAAYLNNRVANPVGTVETDERYKHGYGIGLMVRDRLRSIKLSLGWNPDVAFDQPRLSVEFSADI